jgi:hypothetical protein
MIAKINIRECEYNQSQDKCDILEIEVNGNKKYFHSSTWKLQELIDWLKIQ